jgi:hypothetical protein
MADRPLPAPLPADLPEDWSSGQIVAPEGADVGLSEQHGYNYQSKQINNAQRAVNQIREVLENGDIENTVTVEGGGHMEMGESLGGPPYTITVTEETDTPLTADDVGAIPLPDNPVKGQVLIFDGSTWVPGDVTTELPVASDTVLGGVKVGSSLEISNGVLNTKFGKYVHLGYVTGSFSSDSPTKDFPVHFLFEPPATPPLVTIKVALYRSAAPTTLTLSGIDNYDREHIIAQNTYEESDSGGGIILAIEGAVGTHLTYTFLSDWGNGERFNKIRVSSSSGGGSYKITSVGLGYAF